MSIVLSNISSSSWDWLETDSRHSIPLRRPVRFGVFYSSDKHSPPRQTLIPFRRLNRNETLNTQKDDLYLIGALVLGTIGERAKIRTITKENHFFIRHTNEKLTNSLMTDTELKVVIPPPPSSNVEWTTSS